MKAEWLPEVMAAQQREEHEQMVKEWPKGMPRPAFQASVPWMSLGVAPTAEQLDRNDYEAA